MEEAAEPWGGPWWRSSWVLIDWAQPELIGYPWRAGGVERKYLGGPVYDAEADPIPHTCRTSYRLSVPDLISDSAILAGNIANDESSFLPECCLQSPVWGWILVTILGKSSRSTLWKMRLWKAASSRHRHKSWEPWGFTHRKEIKGIKWLRSDLKSTIWMKLWSMERGWGGALIFKNFFYLVFNSMRGSKEVSPFNKAHL